MIIDLVMFRTMGDVLMSTPILHALRLKYPNDIIRLHTMNQYQDIVKTNKDINFCVTYEKENYMAVYRWLSKNPGDMLLPVGMANHYDTCWHHNPETAGLHMIDYYAKRAGLEIPLADKHIRFTEDAKDEETFGDTRLTKDQYLVFHTTSLLETKDWPIQYFNELAIKLREKYKVPIVQIGGVQDQPLNDPVKDLRGKTTYSQTGVLIKHCKFYVGVDSGSTYLAEAYNKPCFVIMGSTQAVAQVPNQTGPFVGPVGPNCHYIEPVRPENTNCKPIPCYNHCVIKDPCIVKIQVDDVLKVIEAHVQ